MLSCFLAAAMILSLFAGCAPQSPAPSSSEPAPSTSTAPDPNAPPALTDLGYEEGTNPTDEIVNTTAAEKVLLVVSFGTSFNQSRALTIGGIESALAAAYPDYQVRRAFTAQIIIDKLATRDGLRVDSIEQAMDRLVLDGVKEVIIQPTTVMAGYEYDDVIAAVTPYANEFESFKVGKPLLIDDSDYDAVADIVAEELAAFEVAGTTVLLMGHGTQHEANATYAKLEGVLRDKGHADILIGTVEGGVLIEDLQALLEGTDTQKVVLRPFMIVAGDHAHNDMAGDEAESWKTLLVADGYEVETILEGLGQVDKIQALFVKHVQDAMDNRGVTITPTAATAAAGVTADRLKNGVYPIEVTSDAAMFKIVDCRLTVQDGAMSAVITLSATGFGKVYMGTAEAAEGDAAHHSEFTRIGDRHSFTVPVAALDQELACAGWSIRREQWYDHTVVFEAAGLPADAFLPAQ